ncbi:MAG: hypothetical protein ABL933_02225 [Methyloglobulus sp.]|nr:hypothetical protein [Methyloglobulus sp.]
MKKLIIVLVFGLPSFVTFAFDINPFKKYDGSRQLEPNSEYGAGIVASIIINPVHEELTVKTIFLVKEKKLPGYKFITKSMIDKVIRGVRWNDDPLHLLPEHPYEWLVNFEHASDIATRINPNFDLLYRSHHSDLQFLHAMADSDSETALTTQEAVLSWIEFSYKVSTGVIPINTRFSNLERYVTPNAALNFKKHFNQNGRRKNWTPAYLFGLKCNREVSPPDSYGKLDCSETPWLPKKEDIQNIALGSMLHVIQDSFSDSHVTRNPQYDGKYSLIHGRSGIETFNAYKKQSINLHRGADDYPNDFDKPPTNEGFNLEEVSSRLISTVLTDRHLLNKRNQCPVVIRDLTKGIFKLLDSNAVAGSGKYK